MKSIIMFVLIGGFLFSCKPKETSTTTTLKGTSFDIPDVDLSALETRLYQYFHAAPKNRQELEENMIIDYCIENKLDVKRDSTGLYYWILEQGAGGIMGENHSGSCFYRGYTLEGREFDGNMGSDKPLNFRQGQLIYGWNIGMTKLRYGGKAIFVIPSSMAYWERGIPGKVGKYEILVFDVQLLL